MAPGRVSRSAPFGGAAAAKTEAKPAAKQPASDEVADLKEEMEAMRKQLAELAKK